VTTCSFLRHFSGDGCQRTLLLQQHTLTCSSPAQIPKLKYLPTAMLTELSRVSLELPPNGGAASSIEAQSVSNRVAADLLAASRDPPKLAAIEQLQDTLARQLHAAAPHSPGQLASAASLFVATVPSLPPAAVPRACALLSSSMRSATAQGEVDAATSVEVLYACMHSMHALCATFGGTPPPDVLPEGSCTSIQQDGSEAGRLGTSTRLLATGRDQDAPAARAAMAHVLSSGQVNRSVFRGFVGGPTLRLLRAMPESEIQHRRAQT
jgi:hypothetical protein